MTAGTRSLDCQAKDSLQAEQGCDSGNHPSNGFWVFQYKLSKETREAFLDFSGGRIDFGKRDGIGGWIGSSGVRGQPTGGPLRRSADQLWNAGLQTLVGKAGECPNRVIEPRSDTIRFSSAVKEFSIVFIGGARGLIAGLPSR